MRRYALYRVPVLVIYVSQVSHPRLTGLTCVSVCVSLSVCVCVCVSTEHLLLWVLWGLLRYLLWGVGCVSSSSVPQQRDVHRREAGGGGAQLHLHLPSRWVGPCVCVCVCAHRAVFPLNKRQGRIEPLTSSQVFKGPVKVIIYVCIYIYILYMYIDCNLLQAMKVSAASCWWITALLNPAGTERPASAVWPGRAATAPEVGGRSLDIALLYLYYIFIYIYIIYLFIYLLYLYLYLWLYLYYIFIISLFISLIYLYLYLYYIFIYIFIYIFNISLLYLYLYL